MVAHTPTWQLPYPDDYDQPADSPNALEDLAVATDAAITQYGVNAGGTFAQLTGAGNWVGDMQISAAVYGPYTINAGQEITIGPIGINPGTLCVCGTQHPSTYLLAVYNDLGDGTAQIKVRNATTATNHSNVKVHAIFINPPGA